MLKKNYGRNPATLADFKTRSYVMFRLCLVGILGSRKADLITLSCFPLCLSIFFQQYHLYSSAGLSREIAIRVFFSLLPFSTGIFVGSINGEKEKEMIKNLLITGRISIASYFWGKIRASYFFAFLQTLGFMLFVFYSGISLENNALLFTLLLLGLFPSILLGLTLNGCFSHLKDTSRIIFAGVLLLNLFVCKPFIGSESLFMHSWWVKFSVGHHLYNLVDLTQSLKNDTTFGILWKGREEIKVLLWQSILFTCSAFASFRWKYR